MVVNWAGTMNIMPRSLDNTVRIITLRVSMVCRKEIQSDRVDGLGTLNEMLHHFRKHRIFILANTAIGVKLNFNDALSHPDYWDIDADARRSHMILF